MLVKVDIYHTSFLAYIICSPLFNAPGEQDYQGLACNKVKNVFKLTKDHCFLLHDVLSCPLTYRFMLDKEIEIVEFSAFVFSLFSFFFLER